VNKFFIYLAVFSAVTLTSCSSINGDVSLELSMEEKVTILENGKWLLKGFEVSVMHTFKNGEQFTFYGTDNVFSDTPIPGTQEYTISGDLLVVDYNFGNIANYELKLSCNNNIIDFYKDGELNRTLYKKDSNYKECL